MRTRSGAHRHGHTKHKCTDSSTAQSTLRVSNISFTLPPASLYLLHPSERLWLKEKKAQGPGIQVHVQGIQCLSQVLTLYVFDILAKTIRALVSITAYMLSHHAHVSLTSFSEPCPCQPPWRP